MAEASDPACCPKGFRPSGGLAPWLHGRHFTPGLAEGRSEARAEQAWPTGSLERGVGVGLDQGLILYPLIKMVQAIPKCHH